MIDDRSPVDADEITSRIFAAADGAHVNRSSAAFARVRAIVVEITTPPPKPRRRGPRR